MSVIPGLGLAREPTPSLSSTRTFDLQPLNTYSFSVSFSNRVSIRLLSGTADKDGTELALHITYHFSGVKSKITTLQGCKLEVDGPCESEHVTRDEELASIIANAHFKLHAERRSAVGTHGPRVLVVGPPSCGKTTLARTLAAYATRMDGQPLVVNLNPDEGMLTLPGTLSAAVFASMMDVEARQGWGAAPASGPGSIPPKVPLVHFFGRQAPGEDPGFYRDMVTAMADSVSARLSEDETVKRTGLIIDTAGVVEGSKDDLELLSHIISEFSVNIVLTVGSKRLEEDLQEMLREERSSLGEQIHVVGIDKSKSLPPQDELWLLQEREADIKEYFFGDAKLVLSPSTQLVDFDSLTIYKIPDTETYPPDRPLERVNPSPEMEHWTLAIMQASVKDTPETIRSSLVLGCVYVADVDVERSKVKLLSPLPGRLGDRPLILGKWPEPHVNLLG
ncbi:related to cleavage/polyadenylation factor IA subunit [Cephalotrichum gorgonifer]|uniref:Polynucleotide 5'-hydroxyl-kinase GRC3 n=1 Tax=Cephalotrichum gorgonifer TaxID=2041049 RepID=A0AAE8MT86_9PEZI|nr:related to cleavage/polyadenylation factor IA subunit [Cephalotrichum gorgonifer]